MRGRAHRHRARHSRPSFRDEGTPLLPEGLEATRPASASRDRKTGLLSLRLFRRTHPVPAVPGRRRSLRAGSRRRPSPASSKDDIGSGMVRRRFARPRFRGELAHHERFPRRSDVLRGTLFTRGPGRGLPSPASQGRRHAAVDSRWVCSACGFDKPCSPRTVPGGLCSEGHRSSLRAVGRGHEGHEPGFAQSRRTTRIVRWGVSRQHGRCSACGFDKPCSPRGSEWTASGHRSS